MADQAPKTLNEIAAAAIRLFWRDKSLSVWDAVDQVLRGLDIKRIKNIYHASHQQWCKQALEAFSDEALIGFGVEQIGLQLRRIRDVRSADDLRSNSKRTRGRR